MKAEELAGFQRSCWRNIAITLTTVSLVKSPVFHQPSYKIAGLMCAGRSQQVSTLAKGDGGAMARDGSFHCELEKSKDEDENRNQVTTIKCHGELVSNTAGEIKEVVRPLILLGGRIIIDLGDVKHLDSAGLGALVGLKTSAINQGLCILELANMTPGVLELLRITHLTQMFSS
jgi:anti-anti-sigma factor